MNVTTCHMPHRFKAIAWVTKKALNLTKYLITEVY